MGVSKPLDFEHLFGTYIFMCLLCSWLVVFFFSFFPLNFFLRGILTTSALFFGYNLSQFPTVLLGESMFLDYKESPQHIIKLSPENLNRSRTLQKGRQAALKLSRKRGRNSDGED